MASLGIPSLPSAVTAGPDPDRKAVLVRRIRWFVATTISYNGIEAIIALTEGTRVSSTTLIGFGLDSVIEVSSAATVAWQFAGDHGPFAVAHCGQVQRYPPVRTLYSTPRCAW